MSDLVRVPFWSLHFRDDEALEKHESEFTRETEALGYPLKEPMLSIDSCPTPSLCVETL
jgi:hypothetical protein